MGPEVFCRMTVYPYKVRIFVSNLAQHGNKASDVRMMQRRVDEEYRPAFDPDIPPVSKGARKPYGVFAIVFRAVGLRHQDILLASQPCSRPWLIGPCQAERKVRLAKFQNLIEGSSQQSLAAKPVMPIAKPIHAVFTG